MRFPLLWQQALRLLDALNQHAGKRFPPSTAQPIYDRLLVGADPEDCRGIIVYACKQWKLSERMRPLLKPSYLFGKAFDELLGELPAKPPPVREPLAIPEEERMPIEAIHELAKDLATRWIMPKATP